MTKSDLQSLSQFNAETIRGLLHTEEWKQKMLRLQHEFDNEEFAKVPLIVQYSPKRQKQLSWWKRLFTCVTA